MCMLQLTDHFEWIDGVGVWLCGSARVSLCTISSVFRLKFMVLSLVQSCLPFSIRNMP